MLYDVTIPAAARSRLFDGINTMVVEAINAAAALVAVKAALTNDDDDIWDNATITALPQNLVGVVFTITIDAAGTPTVITYTGIEGDGWDEVGTELSAAATGESLTSSWTPEATYGKVGTLLVATGSGTDDLGDKTMECAATDPSGNDMSIEFFENTVSEGIATDDLTVGLMSGGTSPRVIGAYKA